MWDTYLYIALMGVSTYVYTVNYRVLTPPLRILTMFITVTFVVTLYAIYVYRVEDRVNIYIFHILTILQYILYGLLFSQLVDSVLVKRLIGLSIGLFIITSLWLSFTIQPWITYNSYAVTLFNLLNITWSAYYLWRTLIDTKVVALEREALFWIVAGVLVTSLGNFLVQGMMNYLITNSTTYGLTVYWIRELMSFVLFTTFLVALYIYLRHSPDKYER